MRDGPGDGGPNGAREAAGSREVGGGKGGAVKGRDGAQEVTGFNLYRDGVLLQTATGPVTLKGFTSGESVTLTIRALNATGEGPSSEPVTTTAG